MMLSKTPQSLSDNDRQVRDSVLTLIQAVDNLVPWSLFERDHRRVTLEVPDDRKPVVDFLRKYSADTRWDRDDVAVVLAEDGELEPHWFGLVDPHYSISVDLPKGRQFHAWLIQIDSVPLDAAYTNLRIE